MTRIPCKQCGTTEKALEYPFSPEWIPHNEQELWCRDCIEAAAETQEENRRYGGYAGLFRHQSGKREI